MFSAALSLPAPAPLPSNDAAIEVTKCSLASAEGWMDNTANMVENAARMLSAAESEHQDAVRVVEEARAYLASIDENSSCEKDVKIVERTIA